MGWGGTDISWVCCRGQGGGRGTCAWISDEIDANLVDLSVKGSVLKFDARGKWGRAERCIIFCPGKFAQKKWRKCQYG
jgi:hypothetical protein